MPPRQKPVAAAAANPAIETPAPTTVAAPPPPPAKPRRRAPGAAAPADPPVPAAAPAPGDPLTTEVSWMEPAADLPPFLQNRAPHATPPVVHIIGEEPCARPMPAPGAARPGSPVPSPPGPVPSAALPHAAPPDGPYSVYVLGDPDGTIHYVGISDNVPRRLAQHLNAAYNPRSRWLQALLDAGAHPHHKVVETVPTRADALAAERKWIRCYRRAGHPLTNGLLPPEPRAATDGDPAAPVLPAAPPAQAVAPEAGPVPPLPARRPIRRAWLMSIGVAVLLCTLVVWGLGWSHLAPSGTQPGHGGPAAAVGLPTPVVATTRDDPTGLPAAPGALVPFPTAAPQRRGSHSVQVQPNQTLADVAAQLNTTSDTLATQLGRTTVYAGEVITRDLYAGDPDAAPLSQGGTDPSPTVDVYTGKGPDAPLPPVVETTVLASTGLCPPGSARAGQPRDGRSVVPFEPGCAPDAAGQLGPQRQPWVPAPPTTAQGGGPPANLPATGHSGNGLEGAADLLGAVADEAAATLEQSAPEPVTYCADGSVRDLVHRVHAPFVPGCAPLPVGPPAP